MSQAQVSPSALQPASHSAVSTLHQTLQLTIYYKHAKCHKSLNSQNSRSLSPLLAAVILSPPPLPQLPPVPQQPNHVFCHIILWSVGVLPFSTNRNVLFCLQTVPACGIFHIKSQFLLFLPAPDTKQAWRQCSRKSMADIIYSKSGTQEVGHGDGLAASYTRTSTDSDSSLLSSRIRISSDRNRFLFWTRSVLLIHKSQFRCTERDRIAAKIPVQLAPLQV